MKIIKWLDEHFEEYILSILLALIACVMMLQVIMRYVFNSSLSWAEELSRYAFIWSAFLSIGYTIKEKTILKVDTFIEMLPKTIKKIARILVVCVNIAFFVFLFINSVPVVNKIFLSKQISPAMGVPMYTIYCATSVGFLFAAIRSIQSATKMVRETSEK
ncbi:MAG: C4-dicarboxylate transporter, DctQ subunit [Tepidanaerobacteraceae bacterium]|nr:C4-dicarboxylate transporter, DctQ subunit [Tepidanaerobacteraceae bacterium]